ncbi:MAG TPA: porin, partial [Planctomycetota bacterium]|nr:porin [Planctomycetota bacterium]
QKGLPDRVSKLEKAQASAGQTWDASKMLSFSTADGNFTAKIGGRIYFVYRHIFERDDATGGTADQFIMDTARFQLDGTFFKDFIYRLEGASDKNGAFAYNDVFVGYSGLRDYFTVQAGQFKVPCSQEETTSSRFIDFAERSLLNRLIPSRDQGIMFSGSIADKVLEWNLGFFNGVTKNTADANDEKDLAIRLFVTPLKNSGVNLFKQTRVGFDLTYGDIDNVAAADITSGDLGGTTLIDLTPAVAVPAGPDGIRTRMIVNFSWLYGPLSLRAEYLMFKQELYDAPAATESDFLIKAFYIQATWLLTGETKPLENRVVPKSNLNPLNGGWGAFELALRYCSVDASDAEDAGFFGPPPQPTVNQKVNQLTVGINWWWTSNMALRINYEHLTFDEDLPVKSGGGSSPLEGSQSIFYVRWQIDF